MQKLFTKKDGHLNCLQLVKADQAMFLISQMEHSRILSVIQLALI